MPSLGRGTRLGYGWSNMSSARQRSDCSKQIPYLSDTCTLFQVVEQIFPFKLTFRCDTKPNVVWR